MINAPVRINKGTELVGVATVPPAWVTVERDKMSGDYMITAETTGVYYSTDDEPPAAFATAGLFLPRDDSIIISMQAGDKFHYYIPAGGTCRAVRVTVLKGDLGETVR